MVLQDIILQVGTNVGLFVFALILANTITKGFFFKYVKVWASRGSLLLVQISHPIQDYYVIGKIRGEKFIYSDLTNKKGQEKTSVFNKDALFRLLGVNVIKVDEATNLFILPDMSVETGYDHTKISNWIVRALTEPKKKEEKNMLYIVIIIAVLILIVCMVMAFNVFSLIENIDKILEVVSNFNTGVL